MKIESVEAIAIEIPLPKPLSGATYSVPTRCTVVTRLRTSSGLVSEVFNGDNRDAGVAVCALINDVLFPAIGGYYQEGRTIEYHAHEMEWLKEQGMAGCKFKVGGLTPEADAERVTAAREGAGNDFIIGCDANRGWSVADARRFAGLPARTATALASNWTGIW